MLQGTEQRNPRPQNTFDLWNAMQEVWYALLVTYIQKDVESAHHRMFQSVTKYMKSAPVYLAFECISHSLNYKSDASSLRNMLKI